MPSYPRLLIVCLSLVLQLAAPQALAARNGGFTFADMLRGMGTALALLGQGSTLGNPALGYPVVPVYPPPAYYPPVYPWPTMPPQAAYPSPWGQTAWPPVDSQRLLDVLQGAWESENGGLLLVKNDLARLYLSRERYQDLYLRADARYLWFQPATRKGRTVRYAYRVLDDRIELYDRQGNRLVLRRYQPKSKKSHDENRPAH